MKLLFNINFARPNCAFSSWQAWKIYFTEESFYLQGILNDINEQDTSFLHCKHKQILPYRVEEVLYRLLPIVFLGFTNTIDF